MTLCRAMLAEHAAGTALGDTQLGHVPGPIGLGTILSTKNISAWKA
jgi:hypothetical protein